MMITKRQPVSVGEMLVKEFMEPPAVTQGQLAEAMGVSRRTINEICNNKRSVTVDTPERMARIERVRPIQEITA
jgi:addiction module HigA family antidote